MSDFLGLMFGNALAAVPLALLAYGSSAFVGSARMRHALWMIVLLRLFLPPLWTVPLFDRTESPVSSEPTESTPRIHLETSGVFETPLDWGFDSLPEIEPTSTVVAESTPIAPLRWEWYVALVLLAGTGLILVRGRVRLRRFGRELTHSREAAPELLRRVEALAQRIGLRTLPEVRVVAGRISPMVWCPGLTVRRAKLLLPAELIERLEPSQLDGILAHELAHLRRGDHLVRRLELLAVSLYWWFPLLGWIRRELRRHEEACCDEQAVALTGDARSCADALVETLVFLDGPTPEPLLASGVTPARDLQRRIRMMMQGSPAGRWARLGVVAALSLGIAALAVGPGLQQTTAQDGPPVEKKKGEGRKGFDKKGFDGKKEDGPRDPQDRVDGERKEAVPPTAVREDVEKARREVEEARRQMEKAVRALVEAEAKLAQSEGRRPEGGFRMGGGFGGGGFFPKEGGGLPGGRGGNPGAPPPARSKDDAPPAADAREAPRAAPTPERGRGPDRAPEGGRGGDGAREGGRGPGPDRLDQLEQQIRRLTDELEMMRRDMRRGPEPIPAPRGGVKKD